MEFIIRSKEEKEEPVEIYLEKLLNGSVCVKAKKGDSESFILIIDSEGKFCRPMYIDRRLGFELDEDDCILEKD